MTGRAIVAVGAHGPQGLNSLQCAMALRAGHVEPRQSTFHDRRGTPVRLAMTGGLDAETSGYDRMVALAVPALREATAGVARPDLPLVLAVPERARPDDEERFDGSMAIDLARAAGVALDLGHSAVVRAGHAGGALALEHALGLLGAGAPGVVVGGVDSYHHPDVVRWLDEGCRLHAAGAEDGFIPGEGAAFFVLQGESPPAAGAAAPPATVAHVGCGAESSVTSGDPNLGQTMTALLRVVCDASGPLEWTVSDVNGERHRVREWSMQTCRGLFADGSTDLHLPALAGDVGAATGALGLVYAWVLWRVGAAPAAQCTIALHSEGAERGVICLGAAR